MTTLTIELPAEAYQRLQAVATQQGTLIETLAQQWLTERSAQVRTELPPPAPPGERERVLAVLRATGLLAELGPAEKARAARSTLTLEQAQAILNRASGKPLSEIILEMRGPKE